MKTFVIFLLFVIWLFPAHAQVNYNTQIKPMFENYGCTGCHGGSGGFFITPYSNIFTTGLHKPIVVPGDTNSVLIKKLKGTAGFGSRMPAGGDPIANADLRLIVQWVLEGAKETPTVIHHNIEPVETYSLSQNFPNPFNPTTKIQFTIGKKEFVSLKVFDIIGKEIATLFQQTLEAGSYETDFSATTLPSGVYMYKIQAGNYIEVRKMLLLK